MPKTRRLTRRNLVKIAGAGSMVGLAGCTGGEDGDGTEDGSGGGDGSGGDGASGDPEIHFVHTQEGVSIDPAKTSETTTISNAINFYDPFLRVDENGEVTEGIAVDWETNDDGTVWTFSLRENVPFHSGNTLTADDVVYSMERTIAIGHGFAGNWSNILEDIVAVDDHTVEFHTSAPFGPLIGTLPVFWIVDSQTVMENEQDGDHGERGDYGEAYLHQNVAGSGPYTLGHWEQDSEVTYEKFDDYWDGWSDDQWPNARMSIIREESTIRNMASRGQADLITKFVSPEGYNHIQETGNYEVFEEADKALYHLVMHTQKEPLDDINVRKALSFAFDYETAQDDIMQGGVPANSPVPDGMPGKNEELPYPTYDLDRANELIDESSYTREEINEVGLEVQYITDWQRERQISLMFQDDLTEIGIDSFEINERPWPDIEASFSQIENSPQLAIITHTAKFPTAHGHTHSMFHPSASGTFISGTWYNPDELVEVLEEATRTMNYEDRMELYREAQEIIVEGYPAIWIGYPPFRYGISDRVEGFKFYGYLGRHQRYYGYRQA